MRRSTPDLRNTYSGCPVCRLSASAVWIDERNVTDIVCKNCGSFTITDDCAADFLEAWRTGDRETLMCLEHLSRYLRLGNDDCDREITAEGWLSLAIDGEHMDDD